MDTEERWIDHLNIVKTCSKYRVSIWQCPQFLFLIMGFVIALAILVTYEVSKTYQEPEVAALIVLAVSAILFSVGQIIINSFERIAMSSLAKSEFISIMSHQLRSPMSAIKWQINMLLSGNSNEHSSVEDSKEYLETIYDQNEKMIKSVGDLLEVNRIEDGDLILNPEFFLISSLTEQVAKEYENKAKVNNVKISYFFQPDTPFVYADLGHMKRVLEHLIDNAVKYSLDQGNINISIEKIDGKVVWKITDEGAGIPKEDQKKVFGKFFRSKNVARYKTSGSGIGLFIARSIIKLSGGRMGFSSSENKGSTFWFSLPVKKIK